MKQIDPFNKLPSLFKAELILSFTILVGIGCFGRLFFLKHWHDSTILAAYPAFWISLFSLAASILLVFVTISYAMDNSRLAHDNHALAGITSEQFKKSQTTFPEFGLSIKNIINNLADSYSQLGRSKLVQTSLWVANLGVSTFMVVEVEYVLSQYGPENNSVASVPTNEVVTVGNLVEVSLPEFGYDEFCGIDIQVRLCLRFLNEMHWTQPRGFNVSSQSHRTTVRDGYHRARLCICPKCEHSSSLPVDGVQNEAELKERHAAFLNELAQQCPDHPHVGTPHVTASAVARN